MKTIFVSTTLMAGALAGYDSTFALGGNVMT
jgi:hypothetical protein